MINFQYTGNTQYTVLILDWCASSVDLYTVSLNQMAYEVVIDNIYTDVVSYTGYNQI